MLLSGWEQTGGKSIAIWSLWGRHAGHNKHPRLCFKPDLRLEWRGQDSQDEAEQCKHRALTLGDSLS